MNAKKIMGAVLVALLAAALFVGAGAAATGETVFVYEQTSYDGVYTTEDGKNTIMFVNGVVSGENIVEGLYTQDGTDYIYVMYPDAKITVVDSNSVSVIGGVVPATESITTTAYPYSTALKSETTAFVYTNPNGVMTTVYDNTPGEWKVQGYFANLVDAPSKLGKTVYTFTVADAKNAITIGADSVIKGNTFMVTVTGLPGTSVEITADVAGILAVAGQLGVDPITGSNLDLAANGIKFTIPESGSKTVGIYSATYDGKATITALFTPTVGDAEKKTAKVTIEAGEITAAAGADFYYLGTEVKLTGTNTESASVYFYIKGNNVALMPFGPETGADVKADDTWEQKFGGNYFEDFDAGTYTIYAVADVIAEDKELSDYTYASVSVALKQPFLTAELSSSVIAQGSELIITGNAEAADAAGLLYYIFGNNFFAEGAIPVEDDGTYEKKVEITDDFASGQYFVVIQHPMYNQQFNIAPNLTGEAAVGQKASYNILLNTTDDARAVYGDILFNTLKRQSSNAAEALCQALDTQNIDDIYVKATFVVATPTATINPVDDVAKGAKLVVSGTSNMAPGTLVTVEMLATAFAANPKESVNSASFIT